MSKPLSNSRRRTLVKDAIRRAAKSAASDDRAFVEALRQNALAALPALEPTGGARAMGFGSPRRRGPRLGDDPRYLKNARKLAERTSKNARILGGTTVSGKEFQDCVAVGDDTNWGCTGTLIGPTVVLTAGHCDKLHTRIFVGNDVGKKGRVYRVARRVRHPQWNSHTLKNDLMLLVLEKRVTGVKPRALATAKLTDAATDARVVGFGTTDLGGTIGYGVKQQTDVPIVSGACQGTVNGTADGVVYGCHVGEELVAGKPFLNRDTCRGDSGGPLYVSDGKGWRLAGVTSRGTDLAKTMCGDGGIYTRVDAYQKWITSASAASPKKTAKKKTKKK